MPLDPNIILRSGVGVQPIDTPLQMEAGRAALAQVRQKALDDQQARQDDAAFLQALQATGGDYDAAISQVEQRTGRPMLAQREAIQKYRTSVQDTMAKGLANEKLRSDLLGRIIPNVKSQADWDEFGPVAARIDPEFVQHVGPRFDEEKFKGYANIGVEADKQFEAAQKANDAYRKGENESGFRLSLLPTLNDEDVVHAMQIGKANGVPDAVMRKYVPDGKWSPEMLARVNQLSITPEKQAELADKAADNARQAQQNAISNKFRGQELGIQGARLGLERQRLGADLAIQNAAVQAANPNAPHGEDFIKTLPPAQAAQVKALAEGRMQFPGGFALKSPYWQQMLSAVAQYDPNFDTINYNARAQTRKDFTSGKSAQQVNALNTVIGHLDTLADKAKALNNSSWQSYNTLTNFLATETGDPRVTNFNVAREAVVDELTRVWRQAGGSEKDIEERRKQLDAANSPQQLYGAIGGMGDLLESKLASMGEQYQQGTGTAPIEMVTPKARQTLTRLEGLAGKQPAGSTAQRRPIPGIPGGEAELRDGRWIRVK